MTRYCAFPYIRGRRKTGLFVVASVVGGLCTAALSAAQKAHFGSPLLNPVGYIAPLLIGATAGFLVAFWFLRSQRFLIEAAAQADELQGTKQAMSEKIAALNQTQRELRDVSDNLERTVAERTRQLEQEIAERQVTQDALASSEARFRQLAETTADWFWELDENMVIVDVSQAYYERTGFDREESVGRSVSEWLRVRQDSPSESLETISKIMTNRESFRDFHVAFFTPNNPEFVASFSGTPIFADDGAFKGYRGTGRDISELKAAENRLQVFKTIFEAAGQGLGVMTYAGIGILANKALLRMADRENDDPNVPTRIADLYTPESRKIFEEEARPTLRRTGRWTGEIEFQRRDGTTVPTIHDLFSFSVSDGRSELYGAIVTDITDQKALLGHLETARLAADEANRAKSEFLSSMSHELRTPLNAILGFTQLLKMNCQVDNSSREMEYLDIILNSGDHLLELVNEVLDLARIEAGRIEISIEPVSLSETLDEILPLVATLAETRRLRLARPANEDEIPLLRADATRFKQVLLNLLSNAAKYNLDGGSITIDATLSPAGDVEIGISDTGRGISAARQKDLFQPFSRLGTEHSDVEGSGIGLVIAKQLVELMGGSIGFASSVGEGSRFWVSLPAVEPVAERQASR